MARKQVIVQLDDRLVEEIDAAAGRLGANRSELLRRAARAFLAALEEAEADRELIEAYGRVPQDIAWAEAARRLASETWPAWEPD